MRVKQEASAPEAWKFPYLLYASTVPFEHEGRQAHINQLSQIGKLEVH